MKTARDVETAAYVGQRVREVVAVLRPCATEGQRREFLSILAAAAPPRLDARNQAGMIRRVSNFLGVRRGRRSHKLGGRQFAFDKAIDLRAAFDAVGVQRLGPLGHLFTEGQVVLTHNGPAEILRFTAEGGVIVTYRIGDAYAERAYTSCGGKQRGSARLQHMPASLLPPRRAKSALAVSDSTKKAILDHVGVFCPTSSHSSDVMKRRIGPFLVEEKPAYILSDVKQAMYADFKLKNSSINIKFSKYKQVLEEVAWNLKKAYRSTCLDRVFCNYKWHREALLVVAKLLAEMVAPPQRDADEDDRGDGRPDELTWVNIGGSAPMDSDGQLIGEELNNGNLAQKLANTTRLTRAEWSECNIYDLCSDHYIHVGDIYFQPAKPLAEQLIEFASLTQMSHVGNWLVCSNSLGDGTAQPCLDGQCERCGFARLWSKGLRQTIDETDEFWGQEVCWDELKAGSAEGQGATDDDLRQTVSGTIIDFLDAFETVQQQWLPHRFHAGQAKEAARELEQNLTPHKLKKDTDW